jgi:putative nucleotidyltransferase with HDIG domain
MTEIPEQMQELLNWINDPDLRTKAQVILEQYWDLFSKIPASKSGRYHHVTENFKPYGLINHTIRCLEIAKLLCEEYKMPNEGRDKIFTATVLHDVGKVFYYYPGVQGIDHGKKAADIAQDAGLSLDIVGMILHHMSHWDGWQIDNPLEQIVAYADYIASKPDIEIKKAKVFYPNAPTPTEEPVATNEDTKLNPLRQYYQINEQIKKLEHEKEEWRAEIMKKIGVELTLNIGGYIANLSERSRTDIDKKLLATLVSKEIIDQVTKTTTFTALSVSSITG